MHNHPSGDPKPSRDDIEMTKEIAKAAEALGISIHDHLERFPFKWNRVRFHLNGNARTGDVGFTGHIPSG